MKRYMFLLVAMVLAFVGLSTISSAQIAQEVDPVTLAGKSWRSGLAVELHRDKKNPKFSFNALTVTDVEKRSFDTLFAYRDRAVYTGFGIGYDVFDDGKVRIKAIVGYTASSDLRSTRNGEWGIGAAIRIRL